MQSNERATKPRTVIQHSGRTSARREEDDFDHARSRHYRPATVIMHFRCVLSAPSAYHRRTDIEETHVTTTGGCLCGQLRYAFEGEPAFIGKCYCLDCHKESGTGHITFVSVPASALTVTGESRSYTRVASSGSDTIRTFCPHCGTTVFGHPTSLGDVRVLRAGTLDDPSGLVPTLAIYGSRAPSWDRPPDGIKVVPEMPVPR
jgi:hypothetical protein